MTSALTHAPSRNVYLTLVLGAITALAPMSVDLYLPALPALTEDLDTGESSAQLTLTACLAGLALGQALAGPLSDALGRRRPLLAGLAVYVAASALCAASPSVHALVGFRLVQGFAGAAGIVIARAVVRDLYSGTEAARFFSLLMLVTGLAPILAPSVGGALLHVTSWRGLFLALSAYGVVLLAAAAGLRETLAPERRRHGGLRDSAAAFGSLARDRSFLGCSLACGLVFAAMFAYIAGSPFVLQDVYGLSPQLYGVVFGVNALGIVAASQANHRLVRRIGVRGMLIAGLAAAASGGVGLLVAAAADGGLAGILPPLFVVVSSVGVVMPNATALALADHPEAAGTASALLGVLQFALGAAAAPLVGIWGTDDAVPMAALIAALTLGAAVVFRTVARPARAAPEGVGLQDTQTVQPPASG